MGWEDLRHLSAFAKGGSLSAAARSLRVEHATVARRIAALEESLGIVLVDRRGRRWTLTAQGENVAAVAERMENDVLAIERIAEGSRSDLSGTVTISAPPALAAKYLTVPLVNMHREHPALTIRIVGEARTASLDRGEADIAIRLSRPAKGDFRILKLGRVKFQLYASSEYLAATNELDWCFVGYELSAGRAPQQTALETFAAGRRFAFQANSLEIQRAAAAAGAGIAALPNFMASSDPRLVAVTPTVELLSRDVWLVVHSDLKRSASVRAVVEALKGTFKKPRNTRIT